jgi:hypothetical protein
MVNMLDMIFCHLVVFGLLCSVLYLMIVIGCFVYYVTVYTLNKIRSKFHGHKNSV